MPFETVDYRRVGHWSEPPYPVVYEAPREIFTREIFARLRVRAATPLDDSPDAHTVRFSEMSAEAEAELAAWDEMLHGRH